ncbi:30S ribosomal protein S5 [bacterium]|nr:30S ribosomal protein S5 [bacterium]
MEHKYDENVIQVKRVSKKNSGGNRISFTALVVAGDRVDHIGYYLGKARSVGDAIKKASKKARENMVKINLVEGTVPHEARIKRGAAKLLVKPAPEGAGIIAGGAVRNVLELAGVRNISAKVLGTNNKAANVKATIELLKNLKKVENNK